MGIVHTDIILENPGDVAKARDGFIKDTEVRRITVNAMVDSGAWTLVINKKIQEQLGLVKQYYQTNTLADGSKTTYDVTEPVSIHWKDRGAATNAVVAPDAEEVLLGALPLEAMDLVIHPQSETVVGAHGDTVLHKLVGITRG